MPQLHFYVPSDIAERIRRQAQSADMSVSSYLANLVKSEVASEWPEGFFEGVVGTWTGETLHRPPQGEFEIRDTLNPNTG